MIESSTNRSLDVGIVIVSYNVREFLRDCLESLGAQTGDHQREVWVVDNDSRDGSASMVQRDYPWVRVIALDSNVGYVRGNNFALQEMQRCSRPPRYFLLLNPDTVVPADALQRMIDFMDQHPRLGAAGPRLVMRSGQIDFACRRGFPSPAVSFYHLSGLSRLMPRSRRFGRYRMTFLDERAVADVDSVAGAFMLVRKQAADEVGFLDDAFFMYGEDLDWAFRIKKAGWQVAYNGEVDVLHFKRESSRQSSRAQVEFYRSMLIFFQKHYASLTHPLVRIWVEATVRMMLLAAMVRHRRAPQEPVG